MTTTTTRLFGTATLCALTLLAAAHARADKPTASAASSAASAAPPSVDPTGGHRDLQARPPPTEASDLPKPGEWKNAEPVLLARGLPQSCSARLLREWLEIRCSTWQPQAGAVLTGNTSDVYFFMVSAQSRMMNSQHRELEGFAVLQLPIRRGDRRLIQLTESDTSNYGGLGPQRITYLLSVRWLDGESAPTVTLQSPS